jgi:NAD(P)-dependent dehydrogenase (short-subunit alcohol dehydrogenase family)
VVCAARSADALEDVVDDVEAAGGEALAVRTDVRDEFDVERLFEAAARFGGAVDVVVAAAGVNHGAPGETPVDGESYSRFDDTLRTNARGVFATFREAAPHLASDARLLVPSGAVARDAVDGMGAYAVSKAAAEGVARGFAADLEASVGVVDPGHVDTGLSGGGGRSPEDVAPMFRWVATDCPAESLDGGVVGLGDWKRATRSR